MGSYLPGQRHSRVAGLTTALLLTCLRGTPAAAAGDLPLNTFEIAPGATVIVEFEVTVDNPLDLCATTTSNQGTVTAANHGDVLTNDPDTGAPNDPTLTPLDAVDLAITKTDGTATEIPGTAVTYTIVASNSGPAGAIGATVADTFPAELTGVTWTCVGAGGGTCTAAGAGNLNDLVNLPAGGSVTYTVNATISAGATGSLANTAAVTKAAGQIECNLANNSATDTDTLTPQVDLAITKTDGLTNVDAGAPTTYTITVTNSGPSDAIGATVADTFPATLLSPTWSCTASPLSSCAAGGAGNINDSVTVRAGGTLTYTVNATVSGTASGTLSNTATVSAAGGTTDTNGGNNSATDNTTVNPIADLSITKTDGSPFAVPGMTVTYTIVAANAGPATATGASVNDTFPASLTCNWSCVGAGGGTCTAGPVAGNIADSVNLPASGTATYTAVCTLADSASGSLSNTATISGGGVTDNTPGNNSATDTDTILPLDFGDAPDSTLGPPWAYPTLLAADGARHAVNGAGALRLGTLLDTEADGQPTANADGDDQVSGPNVDDEDGVALPGYLVACENAAVTINASAVAKLDAFVDFNRDGDFLDAGEKIFDNQALVAGANPLNFSVPCAALPAAQSFARFRISTVGGLPSTGVAADGEVEDYAIAVRGLDFGDAPDPTYPTLLASSGARHVVSGSGPVLGVAPDTETNGQPSAGATGDDTNGTDDEDGVAIAGPLVRGAGGSVTVTASAAGILNAWFDWNGDGNWTTVGDQVFTNQAVVAGPNVLNFTVPATAAPGIYSVARFRVATAGGLSFTGLGADGEVEDHAFALAPEADLSITKTDGTGFPTAGTPVTYTIVAANAGPNTSTNVTVSDTFPATLTGCNTTSVAAGGATGNDSPIVGDINDTDITLPSGSSVTYTATCTIDSGATGALVNTATVAAGPVLDPAPGNNSATDTGTLNIQADLEIAKTDGASTEVPGTSITYTITASNSIGPSDAVAFVGDVFPATITGVTWTCVGAGGGVCTAAGNDSIADGVVLPVGGSVTYTATGSISPAATGSLSNTAVVAINAGGNDPNPANDSATDSDTLTPQADLAITKTDGTDTEVPGTTVTYTIVASNSGPSDAVGATVADTFPAIVSSVTWSCVGSGGSTCPGAGAGNLNALVNLTAGGSVTFTATGTIASSATGTLVNTATVAAPGGTTDANPANNSATDTDTLVPSADVAITKEDSADPPPAGQDLVYTLTVENLGPSDAPNVDVFDQLPAEVTYVSDDCGGANGSPWVWSVGTLTAGASQVCHLTVSINPAPPPTISNTAGVESSVADPDPDNNTDTELTELDAVPPTVTNVDSLADTGDGTLAECESTNVTITTLLLSFDEAMNDPVGDSDPDDVTNPANYLVVSPGPDFDFQTTGCGGIAGDDVATAISAVAYDGGSDTATLSLAAPLSPAQHRLFACDTLTDLAGNPLDGDGDSTAGGDFARAFRADPGNLFVNGHFDCDLADWSEASADPAEIAWTGLEDADDADSSGSVFFTNLAPGTDTTFALFQCYPVPGAPSFQVGARLRLDAAPGTFIGFSRRCEFFSAPGCTSSLGSQTTAFLLSDTSGSWIPFGTSLTAPAGVQSARCDFQFETPTGEPFDAFLDAATFVADTVLFIDGFESGTTSAWSSTVP